MIQVAANRLALFLVILGFTFACQATAKPDATIKNLPLPEPELISTLSELMSALDIPHHNNLHSLIKASQRWRRKPDQERWEVADLQLPAEKQRQVMELLSKLGLTGGVMPKSKKFHYAIMLSGTAPRMRARLQQLVKNWEAGVRFNQVIFLTSQRILNPAIDKIDELVASSIGADKTVEERSKATPATEFEAAQLVYFSTPMPDEMRKLKVHYTSTPRDWLGSRWQRKNTRQGMQEWLSTKPTKGSTLIVSNQPHVLYQGEVAYQEFPPGFSIEMTGGVATPDNQNLINYLDALALWLHNLEPRLTNKSHIHSTDK
ncbi:hypothetical protein EOPP23_11415 [Endozoicomonas sp. OPT23]|uniref:hypothetical protein n=1 Tax=Endozoicomonas sp. OPT23 TaxID=2072845 RepID=UPI00129BB0BD|nr:hypothetical protein [Endozoicomonas sp. OPT23]MRI33595.1 hypothetical protein [Endozoicomonas sp. OPT23]